MYDIVQVMDMVVCLLRSFVVTGTKTYVSLYLLRAFDV